MAGPDDVIGTSEPATEQIETVRPKRRWPRRLLIGANITLILVLVAAGIGYGYLHYRLGQIKKFDVAGETAVGGGQPLTILVAGSDSRAGEPAGAASHFGSASLVGGQRSDVILLIRINPATSSASMLSIPRDTAVTLAGTTHTQKINVAFDNGPSQLVQTITDTFGIQINHVVQVTFTGVMDVDNAVGGVCMNFPYPVRDGSPSGVGSESGLYIHNAGQHTLNGDQALALLRSRYYQYYKDGYWHPEGTGDIGRIIRQHTFLRALASKALHEAVSNPLKANSLAGDAVQDVTVDSSFSSNSILGLVTEMRSLHPSSIPSWTLPTTQAYTYYLGDYLKPDLTADQAVIQQWLNYRAPSSSPSKSSGPTTTTTISPGSVTVAVRNGTGKAGQAGSAANGLIADGFHISDTGDAPNFQYTRDEVHYGSGGEAAAKAVAADVLGGAKVVSDKSLADGAVELITGADYTGIRAVTPPPTTSTTTPSSGAGGTTANESIPPWDPTPCSG